MMTIKPFPPSVKKGLLGLIIPVSLGVVWELSAKLGWLPNNLLAPPSQITQTFWDLWAQGDLLTNLQTSLLTVLEGYIVGITVGFSLGVAMGASRVVEAYVGPLFHAVRQVPLFGWVPLLILACGTGGVYRVVFVSIGAFYPMVINTYEGIRDVPKEYVELGEVFEYGKFRLLRRIILPAALPSILTGLKLSLSMSWMAVVGAEFIAASNGIGYMMSWARTLFQFDVVMVGVITVGIVGFVLNAGIVHLEKRLLMWRKTINVE